MLPRFLLKAPQGGRRVPYQPGWRGTPSRLYRNVQWCSGLRECVQVIFVHISHILAIFHNSHLTIHIRNVHTYAHISHMCAHLAHIFSVFHHMFSAWRWGSFWASSNHFGCLLSFQEIFSIFFWPFWGHSYHYRPFLRNFWPLLDVGHLPPPPTNQLLFHSIGHFLSQNQPNLLHGRNWPRNEVKSGLESPKKGSKWSENGWPWLIKDWNSPKCLARRVTWTWPKMAWLQKNRIFLQILVHI